MAHMLPPELKEFDPRSKEDVVFRALSRLPDEYYVFHSVNEVVTSGNTLYDREVDFLIAHPEKGLLCLECKAGEGIVYHDRDWWYYSGKKMSHGGPYKQVATAKATIKDKIRYHATPAVAALEKRVRMLHAVCFIDMTAAYFDRIRDLPEDANRDLTIFAEDLLDLRPKIESIYSLQLSFEKHVTREPLTKEEFSLLLNSVLCPYCQLIPSPKAKLLSAEFEMAQLLREQYRLLDFLEDQNCAVINGAAGTGKTMVAVEKARRHSLNGEKVLFLCYNTLLRDHLYSQYKRSQNKDMAKQFENVDFMTISRLTKEKTGNIKDYVRLNEWLLQCLVGEAEFGYQHVIIDEGQDFGLVDNDASRGEAAHNVSIINSLQEVALETGGTFYLFYDKYQMIQGGSAVSYDLPDCIEHADCRLSLKTNCRNTQEIAKTSMTPLRDYRNRIIRPTTACTFEQPVKPVLQIVENDDMAEAMLHATLYKYQKAELSNSEIVIITPGAIEASCIADKLKQGTDSFEGYHTYAYNGARYRVTTSRKFKGLEAQAIVMIDLNKDSFAGQKGLEFYVGTSRAKTRLDLICTLQPSEYADVAKTLDANAPISSNPKKMEKVLSNIFAVVLENA